MMMSEAIINKVATLRAYATILETPKRETRYGPLIPPTEIIKAAAEALRYQADSMESNSGITAIQKS
jgi:hypothetical protein